MSIDDFINYLSKNPKYAHITWENHFLPQIHKIVNSVLVQCNELFESPNQKQYFELYGFDLTCDSKLNLWLIEVNMSPACAER